MSSAGPIAEDDVANKEKLRSLLEKGTIDPANGSEEYVWKKEVTLLDTVRGAMGLPPYNWTSLTVRDPDIITRNNIL